MANSSCGFIMFYLLCKSKSKTRQKTRANDSAEPRLQFLSNPLDSESWNYQAVVQGNHDWSVVTGTMEFDDFPYIGNRFTPTDELHHLSEGDENDPESVGVNSGINRALSENVGKSMQKPIPSIPTPFNGLFSGKKTKSTGPTRFYVILREKQSFRLSGSLKPIHWVVSMSPGFGLGWARNTSWTTLAGAPWSPWCRSPTLGCWPTKDGEQWTVG